MGNTSCPFYSSLEDATTLKQASFCSFYTGLLPDMLFAGFWRGQCRVFSRDLLKGGNIGVLAGGRGVLGVYYLLENIIHYFTTNPKGGEDSSQGVEDSPPLPPLENT